MRLRLSAALAAATFLASSAWAQGPGFRTPGMPTFGNRDLDGDQATRFSNEFNPAFSFVVDVLGDYQDIDNSTDGFDLSLRTLELGAQAWVDPNAWAYFIGATEGESLAIEEAAIHYVGFEGNSTLRAGRFFIDFGKQMQTHVHELRTLERPLALRAFLGEEVKGDGLQWNHWTSLGDATALRWSIGAFGALLPEENALFEDQVGEVASRKDIDDLNFTARVTGFSDLSAASTLQLGLSARMIPEYEVVFESTGDAAAGLESSVFGADITYGWVDDTSQRNWTIGAEYLFNTGDTVLDNSTPGTVNVISEDQGGYFAFVDYAFSRSNNVGLQYSAVELPDVAGSDASELEVYFTHLFSEFQRLRFGVAAIDQDNGDDSLRVALQYTAVLGSHGHGIDW